MNSFKILNSDQCQYFFTVFLDLHQFPCANSTAEFPVIV